MPDSVPRFSSFRPKLVEKPHDTDRKRPQEPLKHEEHSRSHSRRDHDRENFKHERARSRHSNHPGEARVRRSRSKSPLAQSPLKVAPHHDLPREWFFDKKGDPGILEFGFSDRSKVPTYRPPSRFSTLGIQADEEAYRSAPSRSILSSLNSRDLAAWEASLGHGRSSSVSVGADDSGLTEDFMPFDADAREERRTDSFTASGSGDEAIVEEFGISSFQNEAARRHKDMRKTLDSNPKDVAAWLEFVDFQEEWAAHGLGSENESTGRIRPETISKLRLAVIEEGLKAIASEPTGREPLLLAKIDILSKLLSPTELQKRLETMIRADPDLLNLRLRYVNALQTGLIDFQFEACQDSYQTLLRDVEDNASALLILQRYTAFLWDCGHSELATALWQMLLEVSFFKPDTLGTFEDIRTSFERFWDSELPRIGEDPSSGWCNATEAQLSAEPPPSIEEAQSNHHTWSKAEKKSISSRFRPGKMLESDCEDDPYHILFFSDLAPLLETCCRDFVAEDVMTAFLEFCGLPTIQGPKAGSNPSDGSNEGFLDCLRSFDLAEAGDDLEQRPRSPGQDSFSAGLVSPEALFSSSQSHFNALVENSRPDPSFVENVLRALAARSGQESVVQDYYLAFTFALSPKRARKAAKALLKTHPSSIHLYNDLALIEAASGSLETSQKVFSTAISMSDKFSVTERAKVAVLQRSWVWSALVYGSNQNVLEALASIGFRNAGDKPKQDDGNLVTRLSAAQEALSRSYLRDLSEGSPDMCIHHVACLAMLAYLVDLDAARDDALVRKKPSLGDAFHCYEKVSAILTSRLSAHHTEHFHQSLALLILHHVQNYSRALLPADLAAMLTHLGRISTLFPANLLILRALSSLTPRTDRIRTLLPSFRHADALSDPQTLAAWTVVIEREMQHGPASGGSDVSVRRAFERATRSACGAHAAALWAWWVRWETRGQRPRVAKDVWLRGWQALPWVKAWLVLGLEILGDTISGEGALRYYDVLVDRGLRVCVDMREVPARPKGQT